MFTGIVEYTGSVESLDMSAAGGRLCVNAGRLASGLSAGASIAVNGCCLTAVEIAGDVFGADLSPETIRRTAFGEMKPGARVNLERPLTAGKEIGGHFVQGHVDGVGRVAQLSVEGDNWWLGVRVPTDLDRYIALKGSIAIDGVSLTVAGIAGGIVEAAIIPFTFANTNLQALKPGAAVNLEVDIIAKYIERLTEARRTAGSTRLSVERLIEEGF
jgi:riboflavin synthase